MALLTRTMLTSLILTYETNTSYLQVDPQGCALFSENNPEPVYRIQEPLLLAHGIMTDSKTTHLVLLKTNGDLCYTLISGTGTPQTTIIAKLDVRRTRYRRLFLFPQGKIIHIFYASTHQSIPELWRIQHRVWNGTSWHSTHMGEVVHPREPLYHVNLDSQGNLHFLTITFQGRYSLLFTNRFNGTFHIWGSPTETLRISGEVIDMATLMTSDNCHHLYWVVKTSSGQYELRSAQQTDAHELASTWHPSPAPIKTFNTPIKNIGALEINGILWLLAYTGEENLMQNDGTGWKLVSSHTPFRQFVQWVHKSKRNFHQTYWLEDQRVRHAPAYHHELGFSIHPQTPSPTPYQTIPTQAFQLAPPPVPAFYPEQLSSHCDPLSVASVMENINAAIPAKINPVELDTPNLNEVTTNLVADSEEVPQPMLIKENKELKSLIKTVTHLEQENSLLNLAVQDMLSKFDQIIGIISENALQAKQEADLPPFDELEPVKEAMSHLEKETQNLSQVLQVMLGKQEERDSSLEKLETQISQLQLERDDLKNKGGFWNKWIT